MFAEYVQHITVSFIYLPLTQNMLHALISSSTKVNTSEADDDKVQCCKPHTSYSFIPSVDYLYITIHPSFVPREICYTSPSNITIRLNSHRLHWLPRVFTTDTTRSYRRNIGNVFVKVYEEEVKISAYSLISVRHVYGDEWSVSTSSRNGWYAYDCDEKTLSPYRESSPDRRVTIHYRVSPVIQILCFPRR
jgi:hypothetical protein